MKILVFTEGTVLMHVSAEGVSREERVRQSREFGIQKEEKSLKLSTQAKGAIQPGAINDYRSYIPIGDAVKKLKQWKQQGAAIYYLTSRRIESEIEAIKKVLQRYSFPDTQNLLFRKTGEDYKDVAEQLKPEILIEDDCESIGGGKEMTITFIKPEIKQKIKSVVAKEFGGIDHLPDDFNELYADPLR